MLGCPVRLRCAMPCDVDYGRWRWFDSTPVPPMATTSMGFRIYLPGTDYGKGGIIACETGYSQPGSLCCMALLAIRWQTSAR